MGIAAGLGLYLLQTYKMSDFWKTKGQSAFGALFFVIGVIVIVGILIVINILKKKYNLPALTGETPSTASTGAPARRFSGLALRRLAGSLGLNRNQTKMLDFVFTTGGVEDLEKTAGSADLLDDCFKQAYRLVERDDGDDAAIQEKLSILFSIRNALEAGSGGGSDGKARDNNRRFRRRQAAIASSFYVARAEQDRSGGIKLVLDKQRLTGTIMDISLGGCSISTGTPAGSGTKLKIEFSRNNTAVAVLGQVLRTNQSGADTVVHVKFLKIPRRSMNAINAFVYEYDD
jgi:hypothetical protein